MRNLTLLFIFLILDSFALAWDGPPAPIGGGLINLSRPTSYLDGTFMGFPNGSTPLDGRIRLNALLMDHPSDTIQANFKSEIFQLPNSIPLGASGINAPTNLWGFDLTGFYKHVVDSSHDWGLILTGGSDSDIPFNSINEVDYGATGTYHWQVDPLHAWVFLLNYSLTRSFAPGIPLPGAGYFVIYPENHVQVFYGLPFYFGWEFSPGWKVTFTYFILTSFFSELSYKISPILKATFNFQWNSQTWLRAYRSDNSNHIIFDQKKIAAGLSASLSEPLFLNLSLGFAFDQRITEAYSITSQNLVYNYLPVSAVGLVELAYKF